MNLPVCLSVCLCVSSDDLLFIWLVLLNEYITPVPSVANTTKGTDLKSLYCMIKNCGQKIVDCVTDTTCKKGLDCLDGCAFNDQVSGSARLCSSISSYSSGLVVAPLVRHSVVQQLQGAGNPCMPSIYDAAISQIYCNCEETLLKRLCCSACNEGQCRHPGQLPI